MRLVGLGTDFANCLAAVCPSWRSQGPFRRAANIKAEETSMRRTAFIVGVTVAVGIALGGIGHQFHGAGEPPVKVTELLKVDLAGGGGREAGIFLVEIAPGGAVGKHYHPGDAFGYVLEGAMALEVEGKTPVTLKPGDSGHVPPKQVHDDKNPSQTAPVKFLVFHVAEKGQPLAVPAQ
jgi:quercetin dioxygenase-like cupin family protein